MQDEEKIDLLTMMQMQVSANRYSMLRKIADKKLVNSAIKNK